jgi:hypothetical protein
MEEERKIENREEERKEREIGRGIEVRERERVRGEK